MSFIFILEYLRKFLKFLPYVGIVAIIIFGVVKLESCTGGLSESKEVLKVKLDTQKQINGILKESNKDNVETIKDLGKSSQVTLDTVVKQTVDEKKISDAANAREIEVKKKLADALKSYHDSSKDLEAMKQKDLSISTIQINSVWGAYCDGSTTDPQCKAAS